MFRESLFPMKKRVFLFIFQCLPLFLPSLSHFPIFTLSLSISLFLYLVIFLLSSFLVFFLSSFLVFCFSFSACLFAFVSCKEQHQILHFKGCFINSFVFLVSCCVLFFKSPFLIFTFSFGLSSPNPSLLRCFCVSCSRFSFV